MDSQLLICFDAQDDASATFFRYDIAYVLKEGWRSKVPQLHVMVLTYSPCEADAVCTFKDTSGSMKGTLHRRVLLEYPTEIRQGAVLVLQGVSIFSPSASSHYLNVTPENIVQVFPADTPLPIGLPAGGQLVLSQQLLPNTSPSQPPRRSSSAPSPQQTISAQVASLFTPPKRQQQEERSQVTGSLSAPPTNGLKAASVRSGLPLSQQQPFTALGSAGRNNDQQRIQAAGKENSTGNRVMRDAAGGTQGSSAGSTKMSANDIAALLDGLDESAFDL